MYSLAIRLRISIVAGGFNLEGIDTAIVEEGQEIPDGFRVTNMVSESTDVLEILCKFLSELEILPEQETEHPLQPWFDQMEQWKEISQQSESVN